MKLEKNDVKAIIKTKNRKTTLLAIIFVGVYALIPTDLMPDIIPILGYVDDLLVTVSSIALAFNCIKKRNG